MLRKLAPEPRQVVIKDWLSASLRRALEQWMLAEREKRTREGTDVLAAGVEGTSDVESSSSSSEEPEEALALEDGDDGPSAL